MCPTGYVGFLTDRSGALIAPGANAVAISRSSATDVSHGSRSTTYHSFRPGLRFLERFLLGRRFPESRKECGEKNYFGDRNFHFFGFRSNQFPPSHTPSVP